MIVAAHQPSYLPWLGYLDKLAKADLFVVMDDLQYEAQNFQNRNRIKLNNGAAWLTVPLERGHQSDRICDKRIRNDTGNPKEHWQRKSWVTIETHYRRAGFFEPYAAELADVYQRPWQRLVDLDLHMLELARAWLGITTPVVLASSLQLEGQKSDRILDMCKKVGARVYLSGAGASTGYLDVELLRESGVSVAWQTFRHPEYPQLYPQLGFVKNLGFIDLVFNCGPDARAVLETPSLGRAAG